MMGRLSKLRRGKSKGDGGSPLQEIERKQTRNRGKQREGEGLNISGLLPGSPGRKNPKSSGKDASLVKSPSQDASEVVENIQNNQNLQRLVARFLKQEKNIKWMRRKKRKVGRQMYKRAYDRKFWRTLNGYHRVIKSILF